MGPTPKAAKVSVWPSAQVPVMGRADLIVPAMRRVGVSADPHRETEHTVGTQTYPIDLGTTRQDLVCDYTRVCSLQRHRYH